jgi:hypothetical protein
MVQNIRAYGTKFQLNEGQLRVLKRILKNYDRDMRNLLIGLFLGRKSNAWRRMSGLRNREYQFMAVANERWHRRALFGMMGVAVALLTVLAFNFSAASQITGRVVGVTDGDTVTVLDANKRQIKVRLAGIDAPEKRQAFSDKAGVIFQISFMAKL